MAYYNSIRILMSTEAFKLFKDSIEQDCVFDDINNPLDNLNVKIVNKEQGAVYFGWDDIGWFYDWYTPYNVINKNLNLLEALKYSYRLTRIGEEYDDIEEIVEDGEIDSDLDFIQIIRKFDDSIFMNEGGE